MDPAERSFERGKDVDEYIRAELQSRIDNLLRILVFVMCPPVGRIGLVGIKNREPTVQEESQPFRIFAVMFMYLGWASLLHFEW